MAWLRRQARYINIGVLASWLIVSVQQSWNRGWIAWIDIPLLLALFVWACLGIKSEKKS